MNVPNTSKPAQLVHSQRASEIGLIVLDIDGTIMDQSEHIRDSVVQAVQVAQRRGVAVAIATGRLYQSSLHAYHSIGSTLPLICFEGALIREPHTGFVHRHWPLETQVAAQILGYTEELDTGDRPSVHFHIQDKLYVSKLSAATIEFCKAAAVEPILVNDFQQLLSLEITKVMILGEDCQVINRISNNLKHSQSRIQVRYEKSTTRLEAFHPVVNKRLAVSYLAEEILALKPENVMAIGDDFTDIEMFQYAGMSVAMGNAPVAVKEFADWITTNIEEDGVAQAIETWIEANG